MLISWVIHFVILQKYVMFLWACQSVKRLTRMSFEQASTSAHTHDHVHILFQNLCFAVSRILL